MKAKAINHPDFGKLVWDDQFERYSVTVGEGEEAFEIGFDESDRERLDALLEASASLWRVKEEWFVEWRKACFGYYVQKLKKAWYEGKEPLDEGTFNAKLGQPAGIDFSWDEGKLRYLITGMDDDLVGDHALEAYGSDLTPDEICLT
jgi:hypothetical protein